jgi:ribonuclease Z
MACEVTVLGCGEAFDERFTNTSLLLRAERKAILLDCGYSAPAPLWNALADPDGLDLIYISHQHADHCFGLPAVLGRMWEEGRRKPLVILSQPPVLGRIRELMDAGYRAWLHAFSTRLNTGMPCLANQSTGKVWSSASRPRAIP